MNVITEFCSRKQREGENVRVYGLALESLSRRAFPDSLNLERYIIEQFINGMKNKQMQLQFLQNRPNSVKKLIELASKMEEAYERQDDEVRRSRNQSESRNPVNNTQSYESRYRQNSLNRPTDRKCYWCNSMGHEIRDCEARQKHLGINNNGGQQTQNGQQAQTNQSQQRPQQSTTSSNTNINNI